MNIGAPYRPPASSPGGRGWTSRKLYKGGCFQHWRQSEAAVPKWTNVTDVVNFICGISPARIPPYTRESYMLGGTEPNLNCNNTGENVPGDAHYCDNPPTWKPCGPWLRREFSDACASGQERIDVNCLAPTDDTASVARCQKVGFKGVLAAVAWYGQWGYEAQPYDLGSCTATFPIPTLGTNEQVKYRQLSFTGSVSQAVRAETSYSEGGSTYGDPIGYTATATATLTIDLQSGVVTVSGASYSIEVLGDAPPYNGEYNEHWAAQFEFMLQVAAGTTFAQQYDGGGVAPAGSPPGGFGTPGMIIDGIEPFPENGCPDGRNYTWKGPINQGPPPHETIGIEQEWDHTNTHLHWRLDIYQIEGGSWDKEEDVMEITCDLSLPYNAADLVANAKAHLAHWDLSDDKVYPWRTDLFTMVNPMVCFDGPLWNKSMINGTGDAGSPATYWAPIPEGGHAWRDRDADTYTGNLRGLPFTRGYPVLVSSEEDQRTVPCALAGTVIQLLAKGDNLSNIIVERMQHGGVLNTGVLDEDYSIDQAAGTVTILPPVTVGGVTTGGNCVCDCLNVDGSLAVRVRSTISGDLGGCFDYRHVDHQYQMRDGVYAENIKLYGAWSGGSGGADITNACQPHTASQWTDSEIAQYFPPKAFQLMFGNASQWAGVLWSQKYAEIKLPWKSQIWAGPCGADRDLRTGQVCQSDGEGGCELTAGDLVWPDAWPIEGDRGVTFGAPAGGIIKATLSAPAAYLRPGDKVDFTAVDGGSIESNAGAGFTALDVNDGSHGGDDDGGHLWFTFAAGAAPAGGRVKSHGAPGFWWFDSDGKGEFSAISHSFDYRGNVRGVADLWTLDALVNACLPFVPCYPAVMCFSPNYDAEDEETIDSFDNGRTYGFSDFLPDERFGAQWQGFFRQVMADLKWRAPNNPDPCANHADEEDPVSCRQCAWLEDSGFCRAGSSFDASDDCAFITDENGHVIQIGARYYAHRPFVEARETMPAAWNGDSQPTWFTDTIAYAPAAAVGRTEGEGNPQGVPNQLGDLDAPWQLWLGMQSCICRKGRFAEDYKRVLGCWMCG